MKNVNVIPLWPTLLMEDKANPIIQTEIDNIIKDVEFAPAPSAWGTTHKVSKPSVLREDLVNNIFHDDVISRYGLTTLHNEVDAYVRQYCQIYGIPYTTYERTSWFTLFEKGHYGMIHNHLSASVSGCYYYKTSGKDGNIFFRCPLPQMGANHSYAGHFGLQMIPAEETKIILFPGWLDHGITMNETDETRISLSFNIFFKDDIREHILK